MGAKYLYKVQVGAYTEKANAENISKKLKQLGFETVIIQENGYNKVQVGAFANKENADNLVAKLEESGFSRPLIIVSKVEESPKEEPKPNGAQKILELMIPYIGSKTAHKDFVYEYNKMMDKLGHSKIKMSDAWCTEFVNYMFWKAGLLKLIGYAKDSGTLYETAKKNGTWKSGADDIAFGDVVIYKDKKGFPNHTEFALGGNKFISGNYKNGVYYRTRKNLNTVKGRIRPKYPKT